VELSSGAGAGRTIPGSIFFSGLTVPSLLSNLLPGLGFSSDLFSSEVSFRATFSGATSARNRSRFLDKSIGTVGVDAFAMVIMVSETNEAALIELPSAQAILDTSSNNDVRLARIMQRRLADVA
jgi:hypothetical protein